MFVNLPKSGGPKSPLARRGTVRNSSSFRLKSKTAITASAVMVIDHYWEIIGKPFNGHGSGIPRNRKFVSPLCSTPYHPWIGHFGPQEFFSPFHWEPPVSFS